jgi:hypothetical protein
LKKSTQCHSQEGEDADSNNESVWASPSYIIDEVTDGTLDYNNTKKVTTAPPQDKIALLTTTQSPQEEETTATENNTFVTTRHC